MYDVCTHVQRQKNNPGGEYDKELWGWVHMSCCVYVCRSLGGREGRACRFSALAVLHIQHTIVTHSIAGLGTHAHAKYNRAHTLRAEGRIVALSPPTM
jgi:hypothetical protein